VSKGETAHEYLQRMAAEYGLGRIPGIDLPAGEQATGSYAIARRDLPVAGQQGAVLLGRKDWFPERPKPQPIGPT